MPSLPPVSRPAPARRRISLMALAVLGALLLPASASAWSSASGDAAHARAGLTPAQLRPRIVRKFIPFPRARKEQMAAYSRRHYGEETWTLTEPRVIVQHFTTSHQMMDAWWYFAGNTPARGEMPGVCSHFILDTDGTIYQVMPLTMRCRHATGLNDTAIGIEDVGVSDEEIMANHAMMRSSYRLTLWLMAKFGIEVRNVIGHNEIIYSPYHHDLVPRFRCMLHSDWSRPHMRTYRRQLTERARAAGVPVGGRMAWVKRPDC